MDGEQDTIPVAGTLILRCGRIEDSIVIQLYLSGRVYRWQVACLLKYIFAAAVVEIRYVGEGEHRRGLDKRQLGYCVRTFFEHYIAAVDIHGRSG